MATASSAKSVAGGDGGVLSVLARSSLALVEWDADLVIVRWQGAAERIFGWRSDEALGRSMDDLGIVHRDDRPLVDQVMKRLTSGKEPSVVSRNRNVTKSGEVRHCEWNNIVVAEDDGEVKSVLSFVSDVTAQVTSEAASAARLDEIIRAMPDGFFTFDRAFTITSFNPAAEAHFERPAASVVGRHLFDVFPEARGSIFEQHYREILAEGGSRRWESLSPITGRYVEITAFAFSDGITVFFRDVTDRHEAQRRAAERAAEMEALMSSSSALIWISRDAEAKDVVANQAAYRFMRLREGGPTTATPPDGRYPFTFKTRIDGREVTTDELPLQRAGRTGQTVTSELELAFADGTSAFMFGTAVPLFDEGGRVRGMVASFIDVTERQRAMTRVGRLHRVAASLLGSTSEADVAEVLMREGREALGATVGALAMPRARGELELIGIFGIPDEVASRYRRLPVDRPLPITDAFRSGAPMFRETPALDPDAQRRLAETGTHSVAAVPLSVGGHTIGSLALGFGEYRPFSPDDRDYLLTLASEAAAALERIRLFRDAEAARDASEAANRAKDEFLAMLGHELRNPLAPMVTALSLLDLRAGSEGARERAILGRQIRHLSRLVDDLLDVSRITQGKITLDKKPLSLQHLVADVVERVGPLIDERSHRVTIEAERGELVVNADEDRLSQVLTNLMTNAARYTDPGGSIRVTLRREGDEAVVIVADNGIGIEPALLPRIFELFVQGGRALDRRQGGLGLGLAVSRQLVELHGGTVKAHSEGRGRGTQLEVRLPLAQTAAKATATATAASSGRPTAAAGCHLKILVVDDNEDAASLTAEALALHGYTTRAAFDGASALEEAAALAPDVVLLDIGLPVMDGYEVARRLREDGRCAPGVKLVAITGYGQEADRRRAAAAGFDEHLTKPVSVTRLLQTIARLTAERPDSDAAPK